MTVVQAGGLNRHKVNHQRSRSLARMLEERTLTGVTSDRGRLRLALPKTGHSKHGTEAMGQSIETPNLDMNIEAGMRGWRVKMLPSQSGR